MTQASDHRRIQDHKIKFFGLTVAPKTAFNRKAVDHAHRVRTLNTNLKAFEALQSDVQVPDYGEGRDAFKAPPEWTMD